MEFKKLNTVLGWIVFFIALATYTITMEKTGSLWDCGEFLSCTYKLQVAHPPGAPFFMLVGKIFSLLSFGDISKVAMSINFLSATSTAFCSLLFFWSATIILKMAFTKGEEPEGITKFYILGSSFLAALAATFLDSMWFNAIEGEVYAFSVFFMSFNVWAILKWKEDKSSKRDMWLLLIALFTGMSIGVHLLSLLVFPLIGLIIYFDKFKFTWLGAFISFVLSIVFIQFVMNFVLIQTPNFLGKLDLMFVNSFHLPFYSGSIFGIFLIIFLFAFLIKKSHDNPKFLGWREDLFKISLNTVLLFLAFLYFGFTSYFMVVIRANTNPPINMNVPNNFLTLKSYIAREQYGERPLFRGPHYPDVGDPSLITKTIDKGTNYEKNTKTGRYEEVGKIRAYEYDSKVKKFFPRLGHEGDDKKSFYRTWINPAFKIIDRATNQEVQKFPAGQAEQAEQYAQQLNQKGQPGQYVVKDDISFSDNISFFVNFQIGYMYFRYLFWNFAGRTDDFQGTPSNDKGRWISGINIIDNLAGTFWGNANLDQADKPEILTENKALNRFYMIPLLLCLLGAYYNYKRNRETFFYILMLFFATGVMQILFHNQPPIEPRERDYVTAPSFWAFALWIPFGTYFIFELFKKALKNNAMYLALLITAIAPFLMGSQGWDDHNRGNRTSTLAFAKNVLNSCPKDAILFAYGDNDTYPLWYAQEIENVRPDVRVVNTSLIDGAPYISQLLLPMNDNPSVELGFDFELVNGDKRQYLRASGSPFLDSTLSFSQIVSIVTSDDPAAKVTYGDGTQENYLPTTKTYFEADLSKAVKAGYITQEMANISSNRIPVTLPQGLSKGGLIQLQLINRYFQDRPICFINSYGPKDLGIAPYLQSVGMINVFNPFSKPLVNGLDAMDVEKTYELVQKFDFGGIEKDILMDENTFKSYINIKQSLAALAINLAVMGKIDSANKVMEMLYQKMPIEKMRIDRYDGLVLQAASIAKNTKMIKMISEEMYKNSTAVLDWVTNSKNIKKVNPYTEEVGNNLSMLNTVVEIASKEGMNDLATKAKTKMTNYETVLNQALQQRQFR